MANLITFLRLPLLFWYVAILYYGSPTAQLWAAALIAFIFIMDTFDGYVARVLGEVTLIGSALDIATDRTLEIVLWVVFSDLRLIPVVIPLIAIVRGTTVDAVRAVGLSKGISAFDQVKNPISRFLVSSRLMRDIYGVTKSIAFILLSIDLGLSRLNSPAGPDVHTAAVAISWLAIAMTIARGVPVLAEGFDLFRVRRPRRDV